MASKKGDLELRYIILFILGIIVLIALVFIFREQLSHFVNMLASVSSDIDKTKPSLKEVTGVR